MNAFPVLRFPALLLLAAALSACGLLQPKSKAPPVQIVAPVGPAQTLPPLGKGAAAASFDKTSEAEKAAALAKPAAAGARELGKTVVTLGSPTEQGFWLKSALVAAPGKGRITTASGASVAVDLLPGTGGALLSLAAFRALGLSLTDLPEVTVFAE